MAADIDPQKEYLLMVGGLMKGQKISKSVGNIIDPYEIIHKYGLDQIRFLFI